MTIRRRLSALATALLLTLVAVPPVAASAAEWPSTYLASHVASAAQTVDSSGFNHVLYNSQGSDQHLYYATNKSGSWVTVWTGVDFSGSLVMAADASGRLHATDGCWYITNRTGTWKLKDFQGSYDASCVADSIAVDPSGEVHTVRRSVDGNLIYSTNRRGYWLNRDLGPIDVGPTIALDPSNHVHIAAGSLYITNDSGVWTEELIPFSGDASASRVVARTGSVRFMGVVGATLEYALLINDIWSITTLGPGQSLPEYVVDAAGKSHVMVSNPSTGAFDYLTNASGSWKSTAGVAYRASDLAVAPSGRRSFVTVAPGYGTVIELRFASSAPSPWTRTKVTGSTFNSIPRDLTPSIGIGSSGVVKVAYAWPSGTGPANTNAPGLRVGTWNGSGWTLEYPGQVGDGEPSIAVDSAGHAHVALTRPEPGHNGWYDLWYGTDATGSWVWTQLDNGSTLECPVIRLGPTNHPFVLYRKVNSGPWPVFYLKLNRTGSWSGVGPLPGQASPAPSMPCGSLDIDANDRGHLLYTGDYTLRYVNDTTTLGAFTLRTSFGGGVPSALALDGNAKAHVVYQSAEVRYRTNATGVWVETDLGPDYDPAGFAIGYGTNGPVVAWSAAGLTIAEKPAASWFYTALNSNQPAGFDIAVADDGHIWAVSLDPTWQSLTGLYVYRK